ncbi:hypothetical protein ACH4UT_06405 [Streptomyces sp. NPDC020799]|uniref:hypothetical protein n=1 Tax=Streptomyces sp. NPDC020799 TaxID=3365091 RepID=UPI0037B6396D
MPKRVTALALALAVVTLTGPAAVDATVGGTVTNTVSPTAIGVNAPFWNPLLPRPDTPELIKKPGIHTLSFNAGGAGGLYHFGKGGRLSPDPNGPDNGGFQGLTPKFSSDQFARAAHAGMLVHVNYEAGPTDTEAAPSTPEHPKPGGPQEAADWVRYANRTHHYVAVGQADRFWTRSKGAGCRPSQIRREDCPGYGTVSDSASNTRVSRWSGR